MRVLRSREMEEATRKLLDQLRVVLPNFDAVIGLYVEEGNVKLSQWLGPLPLRRAWSFWMNRPQHWVSRNQAGP